jgi:hypothetical protein
MPCHAMPCRATAARAWGRAPGAADEYPGQRDRRRQRAGRAESRQPASNGSARARATQQRINRRLTSQAPLAGSWQASDKHVRGMVVCEVPLISSHLRSGQRAAGSDATCNDELFRRRPIRSPFFSPSLSVQSQREQHHQLPATSYQLHSYPTPYFHYLYSLLPSRVSVIRRPDSTLLAAARLHLQFRLLTPSSREPEGVKHTAELSAVQKDQRYFGVLSLLPYILCILCTLSTPSPTHSISAFACTAITAHPSSTAPSPLA